MLQNEKAEKEAIVVMNSHDLEATKADLDAARAEILRLKMEIEAKENESRQKDRQIDDLTYGKNYYTHWRHLDITQFDAWDHEIIWISLSFLVLHV